MNGSYGNWPLSKYNSPGIYNPATQNWLPWWANTTGVNQIITGTDAAPFFQGLQPQRQTMGDWGDHDDYGDDDFGFIPYGDGGVIDTIKGALSKLISFYKTPTGIMVGIAIGLLILTQTKVGKKIKSTALRIVKNPAQALFPFGSKPAPAKAKRARKATKRKAAKRKAAYKGSGSEREPRHGKHSWHKGEYGSYYGEGKGARFRNSQYKARHVGRHVGMNKTRRQHNRRR